MLASPTQWLNVFVKGDSIQISHYCLAKWALVLFVLVPCAKLS